MEPLAEMFGQMPSVDDVEILTMSEADSLDRRDALRDKTESADLTITFSAGLMAIDKDDVSLNKLIACNAPLPSSIRRLTGAIALKSYRMYQEDRSTAMSFNRAVLRELVSHPIYYSRIIPDIGRFDAVDTLIRKADAMGNNWNVTGLWTSDDFYSPSHSRRVDMVAHGVEYVGLEGPHDGVLLHPERFRYFFQNRVE